MNDLTWDVESFTICSRRSTFSRMFTSGLKNLLTDDVAVLYSTRRCLILFFDRFFLIKSVALQIRVIFHQTDQNESAALLARFGPAAAVQFVFFQVGN